MKAMLLTTHIFNRPADWWLQFRKLDEKYKFEAEASKFNGVYRSNASEYLRYIEFETEEDMVNFILKWS